MRGSIRQLLVSDTRRVVKRTVGFPLSIPMMSQTLRRHNAGEDLSFLPSAVVTQTRSKLTKTFDDTTRVKTRCVTTTSRIGPNKLVTKTSSTTTTKTKRAKIRIEPLDAGSDHAIAAVVLDPAGMLEDFVKTVETDDSQESHAAAKDDDVIVFNVDDVTSASPLCREGNNNIAQAGEVHAANNNDMWSSVDAGKGAGRNDSPSERFFLPDTGEDVIMTSPHDDFVTSTTFGVTRSEPKVSERYPASRQPGNWPEGRSYKELYFDNVRI